MAKKSKTAIGSMLNQLKDLSVEDKSQVLPIAKSKKANTEKTKPALNFNFDDEEPVSNSDLLEIPTHECELWQYKDRPKVELGNLNELADNIKTHGQSQPGLVRKFKNHKNGKKYEIIFGERRWRACQLAGVSFKAFIKEIDDKEAALLQISENQHRKDLSDYAKGMSYSQLISNGVISQEGLQKSLGMAKSEMSRYLAYSAIPSKIIEAIGDMSKVSPTVASSIRGFSNKSEDYIDTICKIGPKIATGIGLRKFEQALAQALENKKQEKATPVKRVVKGKANRHLFTLAKTPDETLSIRFPKDVAQLIDIDQIEQNLQKLIEKQMKGTAKNKEPETA